ncbi:MAG TPA: hypothetical protein VFJ58_12790 [Armatimonadota bacterium]|nr:hypothetical protein [Armatimonadota bacterium]
MSAGCRPGFPGLGRGTTLYDGMGITFIPGAADEAAAVQNVVGIITHLFYDACRPPGRGGRSGEGPDPHPGRPGPLT